MGYEYHCSKEILKMTNQTKFSYYYSPEIGVYFGNAQPGSVEIDSPPDEYHVFDAENSCWVRDAEKETEIINQKIESAYRQEADALFFAEQRGEVKAGTWMAKVEEIKKRYP